MLVACIAFELFPCANIINNDSTLSQVVFLMFLPSKSTVNIVSQAIPNPFCSTNLYQDTGRVWRLKTAMREPVREFTLADEIAEYKIRVDFDT